MAVCVCPVVFFGNRHGSGEVRKLKVLAVRGGHARDFILYSAVLTVSVKDNSLVLAVGNDR
jgi:hypothetical protein